MLLDTCTFIWLAREPQRLSAPAREALGDDTHELLFSHASIWEIYNKSQADRKSVV